jgi:hypothetical protein
MTRLFILSGPGKRGVIPLPGKIAEREDLFCLEAF